MTEFVDQLTIRYLDASHVDALLTPAGDAGHDRVRALLAGVYQPRLLTVESVDVVSVASTRFQVPVYQPVTVRGTWERLIPTGERAVASVDLPAAGAACWLDMVLETAVTVRVSATGALLDAVGSEDISGLSEQDFTAKFAVLDLPGLLRAARVGTYQQLQAEMPRLHRLHYADPPAYDPQDPAARRVYRLRVSALFLSTLDIADALRRLAVARRAVDAVLPHPEGYEGGDVLGSSAWLAVFPDAAVGAGTPTKDQISSALATGGVVAAFETV